MFILAYTEEVLNLLSFELYSYNCFLLYIFTVLVFYQYFYFNTQHYISSNWRLTTDSFWSVPQKQYTPADYLEQLLSFMSINMWDFVYLLYVLIQYKDFARSLVGTTGTVHSKYISGSQFIHNRAIS